MKDIVSEGCDDRHCTFDEKTSSVVTAMRRYQKRQREFIGDVPLCYVDRSAVRAVTVIKIVRCNVRGRCALCGATTLQVKRRDRDRANTATDVGSKCCDE